LELHSRGATQLRKLHLRICVLAWLHDAVPQQEPEHEAEVRQHELELVDGCGLSGNGPCEISLRLNHLF
jgi:hypothetical protein